MDTRDDNLGAEIRAALQIDDPGGRALEIVAILDAALAGHGPHPVVVGGMAVYIWTESETFLTADIDIVIPSSPELTTALEQLGFRRAINQRHWELPGTDVLIEAPASAIDSDAVVEHVAARRPAGHRAARRARARGDA